jgi:hypothetical protein
MREQALRGARSGRLSWSGEMGAAPARPSAAEDPLDLHETGA